MRLTVNGDVHEVEGDPTAPLIFVLRNALGLTGAKLGCGLEQCGSCAVLVDGQSQLSCATAAEAFEGREIVTIEALGDDPVGKRVIQAFVAETAAQCGYCTPGLVVATTALLKASPSPDEAAIQEALAPHLCRCGSHVRVLRAIRRAAGPGGRDGDGDGA